MDVLGQSGSDLAFPDRIGIDVPHTAPDSLMEQFGICVIFSVKDLFPQVFPKAFDDIEVRGIGGQKNQLDVEYFGLLYDKGAMLVAGVVEDDVDRQAGAGWGCGACLQAKSSKKRASRLKQYLTSSDE